MGNGNNGKNGNQPGVHLVIPYYSGDPGGRPLPSADPFWMCTSILVNGSPYAGQQLMVGQSVALGLDAINYGALTAPTACLFWWANPTTAFSAATVNLIGQTSLSLARNALTQSASVVWTVPGGTPEHICLLAEVTTPADLAPGNFSAAVDRHYGQQNIHVMDAPPGGQIRVHFVMANGTKTTERFRLEVTHVLAHHRALRHVVARHAVLREAENIDLRRGRSKAGENRHSLNVELAADEVLDVELTARVPRDATPGSTIVLELAQYQDKRHHPAGGLGVVVHVT
jgi:hypothetical protein